MGCNGGCFEPKTDKALNQATKYVVLTQATCDPFREPPEIFRDDWQHMYITIDNRYCSPAHCSYAKGGEDGEVHMHVYRNNDLVLENFRPKIYIMSGNVKIQALNNYTFCHQCRENTKSTRWWEI